MVDLLVISFEQMLCECIDGENDTHTHTHVSTILMDALCTGKTKCMAKGGDCVVKHPSGFATGLALVVS